jgi:hypothetical protein
VGLLHVGDEKAVVRRPRTIPYVLGTHPDAGRDLGDFQTKKRFGDCDWERLFVRRPLNRFGGRFGGRD